MTDDVTSSDGPTQQDRGEYATEPQADEQGISLDDLSRAYADLVNQGKDPYQSTADKLSDQDGDDGADDVDEQEESKDHCEITPRSILEAILFVGTPENTPLGSKQIAALMRGVRPQEIDELVQELNTSYEISGAPYRVVSVGAGYQLVLSDEFAALRDKFYGRVKEARLSQAAVDILAIVAYNQPLGRGDVDELRGKPSGSILSQLVRRRLLAVQRTEENPRAMQYVTTQRFLDLFGLETLDDLPRSQELDRTP